MKHVDEYRDPDLVRAIAARIASEVRSDRSYAFMEFCGGHTHALCRYGLLELLPRNVTMVHGPGCPVCVLPVGRLEQAIEAASRDEVTLCTFGDMVRVPARQKRSLLRAKAEGADVRIVYGPDDALRVARKNPGREVVFLAIGFETTAPTTAAAVLTAAEEGLRNFSVLCDHVLTPAALGGILAGADAKAGRLHLDGVVGPGHVSTIVGTAPYEPFAKDHRLPIVVAGFEPVDVLVAVRLLIAQVNEGRAEVENQYVRAVSHGGNRVAQSLLDRVMTLRPSFEWRGLGTVAHSALGLREEYADFDAEKKLGIGYTPVPDPKACQCGDVLRGVKRPDQCTIFGTACTPETPVGACMVSAEGACAAYHQVARLRRSRDGEAMATNEETTR